MFINNNTIIPTVLATVAMERYGYQICKQTGHGCHDGNNYEYFRNISGELTIPEEFDQIIEAGDIPDNIHTLYLDNNYHLIQPGAIPDSVIHVSISGDSECKHIILEEGFLPKQLERFDIDIISDSYKDVTVTIPDLKNMEKLTHLKITGSIKCDLPNMIPDSITHLYLSYSCDYEIVVPENVKHLYLTTNYNTDQDKVPLTMPYYVEYMYIYIEGFRDAFNYQNFRRFKVPHTVKKIFIDRYVEDKKIKKNSFKIFNSPYNNRRNMTYIAKTEEFEKYFKVIEKVGKFI